MDGGKRGGGRLTRRREGEGVKEELQDCRERQGEERAGKDSCPGPLWKLSLGDCCCSSQGEIYITLPGPQPHLLLAPVVRRLCPSLLSFHVKTSSL